MNADAGGPYLSVVVTARNDDHGGNPLYRMQAFITSLLRQCDSHRLPAELIIVEWNPPEDRPRLGEVLAWPERTGWCSVRIIEVPHEVHSRLEHAETLPLFQMIAKNVGIRRARGAFVLATNIDLLFDDRLIRRIASRRLQPASLYRVDRFDVPATIDAPFDERLAWCRRSVLRIHVAQGSIDATTGAFYTIGGHEGVTQAVTAVIGRHPHLVLAIRAARTRIDEFLDGTLVGRASVGAFSRAGQYGGGLLAKILAFTLSSIVLGGRELGYYGREVGYYAHRARILTKDLLWLARGFLYWFWCGIREPRLVPRRVARRLRTLGRLLTTRMGSSHRAKAARHSASISRHEVRAADRARIQGIMAAWRDRRSMTPLHTNASGDFTLMARSDWERTHAYPELQRFSMHIDGLFLYQAHYAGIRERVLSYPIFHLEHGSGFRPDTPSVRELEERLGRDGISQITETEFLEWVVEMRSTGGPLAFNGDDWGFRDLPLAEYDPLRAAAVVA